MFYKQKYLLAYYNKKDELLFVADNVQDFKNQYLMLNKQLISLKQPASLINRSIKSGRIKLIDITTETNDIFLQEDLEFKKFVHDNKLNKTIEQQAEQEGINLRTFYRKKSLWR